MQLKPINIHFSNEADREMKDFSFTQSARGGGVQ